MREGGRVIRKEGRGVKGLEMGRFILERFRKEDRMERGGTRGQRGNNMRENGGWVKDMVLVFG